MQALLGDEGFSVVTATSMDEAFAHDQLARADLVLFDYGLCGETLFRELRARGLLMPCAMMSGWIARGQAAAGVLGIPFLKKPFDVDELLRTVREALPEA